MRETRWRMRLYTTLAMVLAAAGLATNAAAQSVRHVLRTAPALVGLPGLASERYQNAVDVMLEQAVRIRGKGARGPLRNVEPPIGLRSKRTQSLVRQDHRDRHRRTENDGKDRARSSFSASVQHPPQPGEEKHEKNPDDREQRRDRAQEEVLERGDPLAMLEVERDFAPQS